MNRGTIKSEIHSNGKISIELDLIENTVWMSIPEIANLFMVYQNTITSNLRSIFKAGILRENEVVKEYRYTSNGNQRIAVYYNLEVIIALCYRINSPTADTIRNFFIKNITNNNSHDKKQGKGNFYLFSFNLN